MMARDAFVAWWKTVLPALSLPSMLAPAPRTARVRCLLPRLTAFIKGVMPSESTALIVEEKTGVGSISGMSNSTAKWHREQLGLSLTFGHRI